MKKSETTTETPLALNSVVTRSKFIASHDGRGNVYVGFKDRDEKWCGGKRGLTWMYNEQGEKWGDAEDLDDFIPENCITTFFANTDVQDADNLERWGGR